MRKRNVLLFFCLLLLMVSAGTALASVVINEIMHDPSKVIDTKGEYIELYNDGNSPVDVNGWTIKDAGSDSHTVNNGGPLNIPAGGFLVLCNNKDFQTNGKFDCDYQYSSGFTLGNDDDEIILLNGLVEEDRVEYDNGLTFPDPIGASMELKNPLLDNNNGANWKTATSPFGLGDKGTPGRANNAPPTAKDVNANTNEDTAVPVNLDYSDADGDLAKSCKISNLLGGTETVSCSCDLTGACTVGLKPDLNSISDLTANYVVNDGTADSNSAKITVTVNPINDQPVFDPNYKKDESAIEDVKWEKKDIKATDIDGDKITYSLKDKTYPSGMKIDPSAGIVVWEYPVKGIYENITVIADDGQGKPNSQANISFNLNVDPFLKITKTAVKVNGLENSNALVEVSPEDKVDVEVEYYNNGGITIGPIKIISSSTIDDEIEKLPFEESDGWLLAHKTGKFNFDFSIPLITDEKNFTLKNKVWKGKYNDIKEKNFTIKKQDYNVKINATLKDKKLSCSKNSLLDLEIINLGKKKISDYKILAYEKEIDPKSFDFKTAKYTKFKDGSDAETLLNESLEDLEPTPDADSAEKLSFGLNLEKMPEGKHKLYVYLIAPEFEKNDYIGDFNTAEIEVGSCPSLEIIDTKFKVGDKEYADNVNVTPGEKVEATVKFKNNLVKTMGHLEVVVTSTDSLEGFFPYLAECQGNDCDKGQWALLPDETREHQFSFTVPYAVSGDFALGIKVKDELADGSSLESEEKKVSVEVIKKEASIKITGQSLNDNQLTCVKITELILNITNTGKESLVPEVLVYNEEPAQGTFNSQKGNFDFAEPPMVNLEYTLTEKISPAEKKSVPLKINATAWPDGKQTLYIYLVSPFFENGEEHYFVSDESAAELAVGPCLNAGAIEKKLETAKDTEPKTVFLLEKDKDGKYLYLFEDKNYEASLKFDIDQSDPEIKDTKCLIDAAKKLICAKQGKAGIFELPIEIKETKSGSFVLEKVKMAVKDTLSISEVKVNNLGISEGKETAPLLPLGQMEIKITVGNYLDDWLTGLKAELFADFPGNLFSLKSEKGINLEKGKTALLTLNGTLPGTLTSGQYPAKIIVSGESKNKVVQTAAFEFILDIQQEAKDLVISKIEMEDKEIACKPKTNLKLQLTNKGSSTEDDVAITVKGKNLELASGKAIKVEKNGGTYFQQFEIPSANLTSGTNTIEVEVAYRNGLKKETKNAAIQKKNCLKAFVPEKTALITADRKAMDFEINLSEDGYDSNIKWLVVGTEKGSGNKFSFVSDKAGDYLVKAVINDESQSWKVTVTDKPIYSAFETNIPKDADEAELASFKNFEVKNSYGKLVFDEPVDLTEIFDLDEVIFIGDGKIAINTTAAPELNKPATLTIYKNLKNHLILVSEGFNAGEFKECSENVCKAVSNINGQFVFTVVGFSTYWALEKLPADIFISEILVGDIERGQNATIPVTVKNTGTSDSLTGLKAELYGVNSKYKAEIVGSLPAVLEAGKEAKLELKLFVPADENGGKHEIGLFRVISNEKTKSAEIYLDPKSYLIIESLKINGKSDGDLAVDETNKITVKVRNEYSDEDLEDVIVTVRILDVDGDDLEEESDEFEIDAGDAESTTVEFDFSGEEIDEEEYELEIEVQGETDSGSKQELTFTQTVKVAREKHKVIIKNAALSNNIFGCSISQTELDLVIENVGKNNEDDIAVKLENDGLGIDAVKENIELDKYNKDDNTEDVTFSLDLEGAPAGTYPLEVKVYRGSHLEDSRTFDLTIEECLEKKEAEMAEKQLAQESAEKLEQEMKAKQNQTASEIKSSFRDTKNYVLLLGLMMILVIVAICLGIGVMVKRKN